MNTSDQDAMELAALRLAMNPRLWTQEMDAAWHRAIPDMHKAFADLAAAARQAVSTDPEHEDISELFDKAEQEGRLHRPGQQ